MIPNPSANIKQLESNNPMNGEFIIPVYRSPVATHSFSRGALIITAKLRRLGCLGGQPAEDGWS